EQRGSEPYWWIGRDGVGIWRADTFRDQRAAATSAVSQQSVESKGGWFRHKAFRDETPPFNSSADWSRDPGDGFGGGEFRDFGAGAYVTFPRRCACWGDCHVIDHVCAGFRGDSEGDAGCPIALERRLGGWFVYRGIVCGREISDRHLPGARGESQRLWSCRVPGCDSNVDLLLRADLSAGSRINSGMGTQPGTGSPAETRRCPLGAGLMRVNSSNARASSAPFARTPKY